MEVEHSDGISMPVSVWTSHIQSDERFKCVVVMEPVQKIVAAATISDKVCIRVDIFQAIYVRMY